MDVEHADVHTVDVRRAQLMASTLRRLIDGWIDQERFGYTTTFGGFLARVAEAIGATKIVRPTDPKSRIRVLRGQTSTTFRRLGTACGVDYLINQWANVDEQEAATASETSRPKADRGSAPARIARTDEARPPNDEGRRTTVKITPNDKGNPVGKLADAELHFTDGLLEGLKLIGFGAWERRGGSGRTVTFLARQHSVNGERRSFARSARFRRPTRKRASGCWCWRHTPSVARLDQ
jgi:hypothetical protein